MHAIRALTALALALLVSACAPDMKELSSTPKPLGDFKLGYNIVVVDHPKILPLSRTATDAEWKAVLEKAIDQRFRRFNGAEEYHIAIKLDAYALAQVGVPLVVSPKSVLLVQANVWRPTGKINDKPEELTVWEGLDDKTLIGSGLTQSKEEQMQRLAFNTALQVEQWMRKHPDWFRPNGPVSKPLRRDGSVDMTPQAPATN